MNKLVAACFLCILGGQSSPAPADDEAKLAFDTYSGYFVSNQFEPGAAESFVVLTDQDQFDKVFGVAMVMGDKSHRLPKDAFTSNIVLATIKNGKMVWKYHVEKITVQSGVVQFRYASKAKKTTTATFACPLIVSIPKGKYTAVEFIENKKPVKKVEIGGR
jgi:outer membrane protein assembly factor BamB